MRLYFLRHGQADWPNWDRPDDERPLTAKGKKEMKRVAKFLAHLKLEASLILSSPLPRAWQTAEIAARYLKLELVAEPDLAKAFNLHKLQRIVQRHQDTCLILVGHEPTFSEVIAKLTGGRIKLGKAGLAVLELDDEARSATLLSLLPPKISKYCQG